MGCKPQSGFKNGRLWGENDISSIIEMYIKMNVWVERFWGRYYNTV